MADPRSRLYLIVSYLDQYTHAETGPTTLETYQYPERMSDKPKPQPKPWFYAVHKGHIPGVYEDAEEAKKQTDGFQGAKMKKFRSKDDAKVFVSTGA